MKTFIKLTILALLISPFYLQAKEFDSETGLIIDKGFETVKANCTVCHSAKFITLQKGDRDMWKAMIVWMQRTQGLWEFEPAVEDEILTYLEKNYPPTETSRRPNLKAKDLPNIN
ncbi:hypothetical protein [Aliarcobacter vitoriensis]|uniref:Molybdenum-containing sulfite:cytochrome c oxidoreductase SorAB, molybdopterin oxidoreductase subunit n=1 Tax=Aliarcobacter vitoriensis TaxID=2011099 RepID=A0A366MWJ6_9BACT|nr:hypothetical protein [Aliarcobacter vitoriensis]RBQ29772.1 hypothetical protein CRU91_02225 [Aliarcobacter vitoriensis]RBQ31323.1 hypothetical protein CRU92_07670 [Arcobacter sp. FW59]